MKEIKINEDIKIINGDCLIELKKISDNSIDAIIADAPYGIDYQSVWRIDKTKRHKKIINDKKPFIWFLYDSARVLKENGCLFVFCRWDVQEIFRIAIECSGLIVNNQLIWDRVTHGMGDLKGNFAPQHDIIWFATKGKWKVLNKRPKNIIKSNRVPSSSMIHPNEKPIDLMMQLIEISTSPYEILLDPFVGSGTTLAAAVKLGRKAIGIEINKDYCQMAKERVLNELRQPKLI